MEGNLFPIDFDITKPDSNNEFSLRYHVRDENYPNSIDSSTLISSLDGFENVISSIADESRLSISLKIRATKQGSFELIGQIIGYGGGSLAILQWFGIDYKSVKGPIRKLVLTIQKLMIKALKSSIASIDEFTKTIRDDPDLSENAKEFLLRLRNNAIFCDGIDSFTKPLDDPSMEKIEILENGSIIAEMDETSRKSFAIGTVEKEDTTSEDKIVKIVYLSPTESKWEFISGGKKFWAEIKDQNFLAENRIFDFESVKGKQYNASITTVSTLKKNALRTSKKHYIEKLSAAPEQGNLFSDIKNE